MSASCSSNAPRARCWSTTTSSSAIEPAPEHASGPAAGTILRRLALGPWGAALLALAVFANSLGNGFTYDDNSIVHDNPRIRDVTAVREIWLTDWWRMPISEDQPLENPTRDRLYRPLAIFSFALNYAAHGLNAFGFHLVNVLLHALTAGLVWVLARRLLASDAGAAAAGLLFAVHPVHVEAVANIVGRAELLAALFMVLGLLALLPPRAAAGEASASGGTAPPGPAPGPLRLAACGACFLLALLAKETAIAFAPVAVIGLAWRYSFNLRRRPWGGAALALLAPLVLYFPLRYVALEERLVRDEVTSIILNPLIAAVGMQRLVGALTVLGEYARLLLVPAKLACDYGLAAIDPTRGANAMTWAGLAAAVGLLVGLAGLLRRGGLWRTLGFLCAIFLASYALISNTILLIGTSMGERLMYWPSVAFVLMAGAVVAAAARHYAAPGAGPDRRRKARVRALLGAALLGVLGLRSFVRNPDWKDDVTLFRTDVVTQPRSAHIKVSLITSLLYAATNATSREEFERLVEESAVLADRVLEINPRFPIALRQRGTISLLRGDTEEAIKYLESDLRINPADRLARRMLNSIRQSDKPLETRIAALRAQVTTQPSDPALRAELGRALLKAGQSDPALHELKAAAELAPQDAAVLKSYADALAVNYQDDQARQVLERAVRLDPDNWEIQANLTTMYGDKHPQRALEHARIAFRLRPTDMRVQVNLAEALARNGDVPGALARYAVVLKAIPEDDPFHRVVQGRMDELRRIP